MDSENPPASRRRIFKWPAILLALLLLYVLSAGPACYVFAKFPSIGSFFLPLYIPVSRVVEGTPAEQFWTAYLQWWLVLSGELGH